MKFVHHVMYYLVSSTCKAPKPSSSLSPLDQSLSLDGLVNVGLIDELKTSVQSIAGFWASWRQDPDGQREFEILVVPSRPTTLAVKFTSRPLGLKVSRSSNIWFCSTAVFDTIVSHSQTYNHGELV